MHDILLKKLIKPFQLCLVWTDMLLSVSVYLPLNKVHDVFEVQIVIVVHYSSSDVLVQ